jgi:hypothetical protein
MKIKSEFGVLSFILIFSGFLLLLENYGFIRGIHNLWPIFPFVVGMGMFILYKQMHGRDYGLVLLGSLLILSSIFFVYLNFTSWLKLSKLWPVFICILGASLFFSYYFNRTRIYLYLGLLATLSGIIFIFVFSISVLLWPMSLILIGIFIYLISNYESKEKENLINVKKRRK